MANMYAELSALIQEHSNPGLRLTQHMVYQIWDDGEITIQKAGDLLWKRSLHTMYEALPIDVWLTSNLFPERRGDHTFIYTTIEGAKTIRSKLITIFKEDVPSHYQYLQDTGLVM